MNIGIAATYAALVFLLFSLPSGRMLEFADRRYQRGIRALPAFGFGIMLVRAAYFIIGLGVAMAFVMAMPAGLTLARIAASFMVAVWIAKSFTGLKRPFPSADNDNVPKQNMLHQVWSGIRDQARPYSETALAASAAIFFIGPSSLTVETAELLCLAHIAASLAALVLYAFAARPVLARLNRRQDKERRERIARLLRSGLPRVSARYRKDAA